jgi:hypothetical protein
MKIRVSDTQQQLLSLITSRHLVYFSCEPYRRSAAKKHDMQINPIPLIRGRILLVAIREAIQK